MRVFPIVSLALMMALSHAGFAAEGTVGGGGGAHIEAAFRLRAQALVGQIENSPPASALCSAENMRQALTTKIRIVDQLIDSSTGKPPVDTNLDAWTIPGDMQLLNSSWTKFFNPSEAKTGRSVDVLVLHEIYRATKSCNDEQFAISDKIFALLEQPGKDSQIFKFGFKNPKGGGTTIQFTDKKGVPYDSQKFSPASIYSTVTVCDLNVWAKETVGKTITCFSVSDEDDRNTDWGSIYGMRFLQGKLMKVTSDEIRMFANDAVPQPLQVKVEASTVLYFQNLLKGVSLARPIYFVYNMEYGYWSYGFNTARLNKLEE